MDVIGQRFGGTVAAPHARRLRAARIARLLAPAAWRLGGYASSEALVSGGGRLWRPAALVALGDPPPDGVLAAPPLLAVGLDPEADAVGWLARGAAVVWVPAGPGARRLTVAGGDVVVAADGWLDVPGWPGLALPARELGGPARWAPLRLPGDVR